MQLAIATGWTPDTVRDLTLSEVDALRDVFKERARAMRAR